MAGADTDTYTTINPGTGGDALDGTAVLFGVAPTTRKRERVVIGGDLAAELADVLADDPQLDTYGLIVRPLPMDVVTAWSESHAPAVNTIATATKAAPGVGKHLVITSITAAYVPANTLPPGTQSVLMQLRAGGGTVLWQVRLSNATGNIGVSSTHNFVIKVADNQSVTIDFNVASANMFESVAMAGYVVTA